MQEEGGNPMAPLLRAVNRIADTLGPTHPHLLFDTLAYEYTVNPPTKTLPASNVVIRVCLAGCNSAEPIATQRGGGWTFCRKPLLDWVARGRVHVWQYATDFQSVMLPFPNYFALGGDIRFFATHNVTGVFEQGADAGPGGELHLLKDFLMGRMMFDSSLDPDELIGDFCTHYFGASATPGVWRYMEILHNATKGYYLYDSYDVTAGFLTPPIIIHAAEALEVARLATMKAAGPSAAKFVDRLDVLKLHIWYVALRRYTEVRIAWATGTSWPFGSGSAQCQPCTASSCLANEPACQHATFAEFRRVFVKQGWENRTSLGLSPAPVAGFPIAVLGKPNSSACDVDCFGAKLFSGYWPAAG